MKKEILGLIFSLSMFGCSKTELSELPIEQKQSSTSQSSLRIAASTAPTISSLTGNYKNDVNINAGKFTGQSISNPKSNAYKNYYVVDSEHEACTWTLKGGNFGDIPGDAWLVDRKTNKKEAIVVKIINWKKDQITLVVKSVYNLAWGNENIFIQRKEVKDKNGKIIVSSETSKGFPVDIVGAIQTRVFGQCTWEVARQRIANVGAGKYPPTAYTITKSIDRTYVPQKWDCLAYDYRNDKSNSYIGHVGIITSDITRTPKTTPKATEVITYSFTITERNAKWDEAISTKNVTFVLSAEDKNKVRTVTTNISSDIGKTANGYYR
jgi:hypothetical protein